MQIIRTGRARRLRVSAALVSLAEVLALVVALGMQPAAAAAPRERTVTVNRCGVLSAPAHPRSFFPKRLGVYLAQGRVSCREGEYLIRRAFTVAGVDTGVGDSERYRDGWVCGGQMGYYFCAYPASQLRTRRFTKEVLAQDCTDRQVGCPRRVRTALP
jgi:hypothetical protein